MPEITLDNLDFTLTPPPDAEPDAEPEAETKTFECCGATRDEDDWSCHNCDACESCCSCWCCESCGNNQDEGAHSCPHCGYCVNCCGCCTCASCESQVDSGDFCGNCNECHECCSCENAEKPEPVRLRALRRPAQCTKCSQFTSLRCVNCGACANCPTCPRCLSLAVDQVVTQKARGLFSLDIPGHVTPTFWCHKAASLLAREIDPCYLPLFARPCPEHPRHGFVDSRIVYTSAQLQALAAEALAADPVAEIILLSPIDAQTSAIWCPGVLTIGPGHDGATAGKGCVVLPVCGDLVLHETLAAAGITESPFVEIVADAETAYLVQLRNGPAVSAAADYIPAALEVKQVVLADADDLKQRPWDYWEKLVASLPQDAGVVVWHRNGALSSHYAVHAVLHKLPVVTSHEPVVGEILEPTVDATAPDIARLREGYAAALASTDLDADMQQYGAATQLVLAACHNAALWQGRQDYLLGFGMGLGFRLTLLACLGELRHERMLYRPMSYYKRDYVSHKPGAPLCRYRPPRETIFHALWPRAATSRLRLALAARHFGDLETERPQGCGGLPWYRIARAAIEMHNALADADYARSCEAFNVLVNCVHNHGWAFDKFLPRCAFTFAADCGATPTIAAMNLLFAAAKGEFTTPEGFRWARLPVPEATEPAPTPELEDEDCDCVSCQEIKEAGQSTTKTCPECGWLACKCGPESKAESCSECGFYQCSCPPDSKAEAETPTPVRVAVAAQVKLVKGDAYVQIAYGSGPRAPATLSFEFPDPSLLDVQAEIEAGHTVASMSPGSPTPYVPLVKDEYGWWTLNGKQVLYAP